MRRLRRRLRQGPRELMLLPKEYENLKLFPFRSPPYFLEFEYYPRKTPQKAGYYSLFFSSQKVPEGHEGQVSFFFKFGSSLTGFLFARRVSVRGLAGKRLLK